MIWLILGLLLVESAVAIYVINPTIYEVKVGNETVKVGVREVINTLVNAMKPLSKVKHDYTCFPYFDKILKYNGTEIKGIPKDFYELVGETIEVCYKEDSKACCINVTLKDRVLINVYPANRTIYITNKEVLDKIMDILEKGEFEELLTIVIKGVTSGEIQGVTLEDIKRIAQKM